MPPLEQVIWFTCVATKLLVAVCASFGCMRRRWPSLAVLFWFQTLRSFVLIGLTYDAQPKAYFYVYWLGSIADCLLSFWLIHDVLHSLPGVNLIPPRMRRATGIAAAFLSAVIVVLSAHEAAHLPAISAFTLCLVRCLQVCWLATFLTMLGGAALLGMAWPSYALRVVGVMLAQGVLDCAATTLMSLTRSVEHIQLINNIHSVIFIFTLVFLLRIPFRRVDLAGMQHTLITPIEHLEKDSLT